MSDKAEIKTRVAKITKLLVDRLQPGEVVQDTELKGFRVRCQSQAKSFAAYYRFQGRQRWYTIGRYGPFTVEQARDEAKIILGMVASGKDPAVNRAASRKAASVKKCAEDFKQKYVAERLKPKSQTLYRAIIDKIIVPKLGNYQMQALTRHDVVKFHDGLSETPAYANRALAVLSKLCNWAEKHGHRPDNSNPCRMVERNREKPRERFLNNAELANLAVVLNKSDDDWERYDAERDKARKAGKKLISLERPKLLASPHATAAIRLLLFTGARLSEILTLKWEYVNFENGQLMLPDSKTGAKAILLGPPALEVLRKIVRIDGNSYIICGEKDGRRLVGLQKIWERIRKEAKLEKVRLHDLRHTFASYSVAMGYGLPVIGKLLGHKQAATTHRYAHLADDPLKKANKAVSNRIAAVFEGGESGRVIPLRKGRKS